MLTIYSTCKPFTDKHFAIIQRNAIKSWLSIYPTPEIVLFGDDEGTAEVCREFGIKHVPNILCSEKGTPRLDAMMKEVEELSDNPMFLLISSDIILLKNVLEIADYCYHEFINFCASISRWDTVLNEEINFVTGWEEKLLPECWFSHPWCGDFFLYTRNFFGPIPPFYIGRTGVDSWLYNKAAELGNLIDATNFSKIIHQNHEPNQIGNTSKDQEEFEENVRLAGNNVASLASANWYLLENGKILSKQDFTEMVFNYFESKNDNHHNDLSEK